MNYSGKFTAALITAVKCFIVKALGHAKPSWAVMSRIEEPGNTNWRGRLSTIDLLLKVVCYVRSEMGKGQYD